MRDRADDPRRDARPQPPDRTGETDSRIRDRIIDVLSQADERAEPGDEERRTGADAESPELGDMSHLMDIDGDDQAERERPAEGGPVNPEEGEHRQERARLRQAE